MRTEKELVVALTRDPELIEALLMFTQLPPEDQQQVLADMQACSDQRQEDGSCA